MSDLALRRPFFIIPTPALLLLSAVLLLCSPATALAHAHYDHSTPSIGQVLATAPSRVDIYTDSEMRKVAGANVITVTAADGSHVDDGTTILDDTNRQHFSVGLNPNITAGRYVVSFQTLSDVDGDSDHGRFAFYVGSGPTPQQQALDASLNGAPVETTSAPASSASFVSRVLVIILAAAVLLVLVAIAGFLALRGRQPKNV